MSVGFVRLALPVRRRDRLGRMAGVSVLLHLVLLLSFLSLPRPAPLQEASAPVSVEIMPDVGTAGGDKLPTPSYAPSVVQPTAPPVMQPAPAPSAPVPAPPMPVPPMPASQAAPPAAPAPPEPPAPPAEAATQAAPPPPPPPAADVGALPLPPPVPPAPAPTPPQQTALARPSPPEPRTPPRPAPRRSETLPLTFGRNSFAIPPPANGPPRSSLGHGALDLSLGPEALNSSGAPPRMSHGLDATIRVEGADVGDDWIQQLHDWWDRHAFYPQEALVNGEDGTMQIHLVIRRDGRVTEVEKVSSSGSRWIDIAGESVFRNAALPPFPTGTPQARADVYLTLQYVLIRHGR